MFVAVFFYFPVALTFELPAAIQKWVLFLVVLAACKSVRGDRIGQLLKLGLKMEVTAVFVAHQSNSPEMYVNCIFQIYKETKIFYSIILGQVRTYSKDLNQHRVILNHRMPELFSEKPRLEISFCLLMITMNNNKKLAHQKKNAMKTIRGVLAAIVVAYFSTNISILEFDGDTIYSQR